MNRFNPFDNDGYSSSYATNPFDLEEEKGNPEPFSPPRPSGDRIFTYERLELNSRSSGNGRLAFPTSISQMVIMNGVVVLASSARSITRFRLSSADAPEEIEISRKDSDRIRRLFLDASGSHLLIVMESDEVYYLPRRLSKAKKLAKLQNYKISAVAFDPHLGNETQTRPFLLGTERGEILETSLDASGLRSVSTLFTIPEGYEITDLYFESPPVQTSSMPSVPMYVLAVTSAPATRLYTFAGQTAQGRLQELFALFESREPSFQELLGYGDRALLQMFYKEPRGRAEAFGLRTAMGIYYGALAPLSPLTSSESLLMDSAIIPYDPSSSSSSSQMSVDIPLSFALTEFHVLLLLPSGVRVLNRLDQSLVQSDTPAVFGGSHPFAITRDNTTNTLWIATPGSVYQVIADRERRHIWSVFLQRAVGGDESAFDFAYGQCATPEQREAVHRAQAEYYMEKGEFMQAARFFAKTSSISFEEVALGFLEKEEVSALQVFVEEKLEFLPLAATTQKTILSLWALELLLFRMHKLDTLAASLSREEREREAEELHSHFLGLVDRNRTHLHGETVVTMLLSHERPDLVAAFAQAMGDLEAVVSHCLLRGQVRDVLALFADFPESKVVSILYTYSPVLLAVEPSRTVDLLIQLRSVSPTQLMPALVESADIRRKRRRLYREKQRMAGVPSPFSSSGGGGSFHMDELGRGTTGGLAQWYGRREESDPSKEEEDDDDDEEEDALAEHEVDVSLERYLRHLLTERRCRDVAILNLLFSLLARAKDEESILSLLQAHSYVKRVVDLRFLFRLCTTHKLDTVRVTVYSMLGLHKKAVELALSFSVAQAKEVVERVRDEDVRRELWLEIAQSVCAGLLKKASPEGRERQRTHQEDGGLSSDDIEDLLLLIEESNRLVTVQDLLQLFPGITQLDRFKEEVVRTLERNNDQIEDMRQEMEEHGASSERILREMEEAEVEEVLLSQNQACGLCLQPAASRQFYAFPCSHTMHVDCLMEYVLPFCSEDAQEDIQRLGREEEKLRKRVQASSPHVDLKTVQRLEAIRTELDGLMAGECPFCGEVMILSVALPLVSQSELEGESEWAIQW